MNTIDCLKQTLKKKEIESFIRNKIATNDKWAIRTLIVVYSHQTQHEKVAEQTQENNSVGFTGWDSKLMTLFAKQYLQRNFLSSKQLLITKKTMKKYWKQVYDNSDKLKLLELILKDKQEKEQQLEMELK